MVNRMGGIVSLAFLLGMFVGYLILLTIDYNLIDRNELKRFNKVHNQTYDFDTWMTYKYEIRKKHNLFKESE